MTVNEFLAAVQSIADQRPAYRLGHAGDDGYCDCIGLIIGAVERCGVRWPGIHGTNWAVRNMTEELSRIVKTESLSPGDLVYKAREPKDQGYSLPDRYADHFNDRDYYHVGVVTQVSPLRIVHCTTPDGIKLDKRLGNWRWHGHLSLLTAQGIPKTIRKGSCGNVVVQLQHLLRQSGYALQADGIFGPMTQEAVRSWQSTHALSADGVVGPLTWSALLSGKEVE